MGFSETSHTDSDLHSFKRRLAECLRAQLGELGTTASWSSTSFNDEYAFSDNILAAQMMQQARAVSNKQGHL